MKGIKGAGDSLKALARKIYSKVVGQGASVLNVSPHTQLTGNNVLQNWGSTTKWPFIPRRQHQITPRRSSTISLAGQLNLQDDEYDQQPDHPISDAVASMIQDGVLEISSTSASTLRLKGDEAPTNSEEKAVSAGHISATSNAALSTASADYDQRLQEQKETEAFIQEFLDPMAHFHETLEDEVAEAEAARLKKQDAHQLWLTESRHLPISGKRRKKPLVPKSKQSVLPSSKSSSPHHHFNRPSLPLLQFSPITDQHQLFLSIMANTSPAADSSTSLHPSSPPPLSAASSSFTSSPSVCSLHSRSCLSHTSALVPSPNECCLPTFGLFALSYQWIRGVKAASRDTKKEKYERIRKEDELRREWTIHGLWPNKCDGSVPNPRYEVRRRVAGEGLV